MIINFFGCIEPEQTSHEIRGLNVVVRLKKSITFVSWPHLMKFNERTQWLKYDYNNIHIDDIHLDIISPFRKLIICYFHFFLFFLMLLKKFYFLLLI